MSKPTPSARQQAPVSPPNVTYASNYIRGDNNNPTNLKYGQLTQKYVKGGQATLDPRPAGDGGNFLRFRSLAEGLSAAKDLLLSKLYADLPVNQALRKWSADAYDAAEIGLPTLGTKKIAELSTPEMDQLVKKMAHYESGFHVEGTD